MEKVSIITQDEVRLSGLLWDAQSRFSVLLLHMMPATKESWEDLANRLFHRGMNVLAIDFRGHGQSDGGSYKAFTDEQHQKYYFDTEAAVEFLTQKYPKTTIDMAGASIGANIMIQYMVGHPEIIKGVALSAGLDYHGVRAIELVESLHVDQELFYVASHDDMRSGGSDCGIMAEQLAHSTASKSKITVYDTGGHGTNMWKEHPELLYQIQQFFQ